MEFELHYGRSGKQITVPSETHVTCFRKPDMPVLADTERAVADSLAAPIGYASFESLVGNAHSACIALCDITRPVPNGLFLRPLVEALINAGIALDQINIIIATGLHRPNEGEELAEVIGDDWVLENVSVYNHRARNDDEHVFLGNTKTRATRVSLDRRFVEADLRIATGLVEPHFMAGYSGGRKVIAPGLAHADTITTFHNHAFMSHPCARNCHFENNPLHEEQLEIVRMLGGALAVNTVIDADRRLALINFGEIVASHAAAVDFAREYCEVPATRKFQTVVTSAAGYPLDKTYYQTIKGMVGAMGILAEGGNLIIASECSEGLGSPEFVDAQQRLLDAGPEQFLQRLSQQSHARIDEWQTQMQLKPQAIGNIHLYSDCLSDADFAITGVERCTDLDATIAQSLDQSSDRSMAIIPEGPYVIPFVRPGE